MFIDQDHFWRTLHSNKSNLGPRKNLWSYLLPREQNCSHRGRVQRKQGRYIKSFHSCTNLVFSCIVFSYIMSKNISLDFQKRRSQNLKIDKKMLHVFYFIYYGHRNFFRHLSLSEKWKHFKIFWVNLKTLKNIKCTCCYAIFKRQFGQIIPLYTCPDLTVLNEIKNMGRIVVQGE